MVCHKNYAMDSKNNQVNLNTPTVSFKFSIDFHQLDCFELVCSNPSLMMLEDSSIDMAELVCSLENLTASNNFPRSSDYVWLSMRNARSTIKVLM